MDNGHSGRRDALAFWLGMIALLLSLVPLFYCNCAMSQLEWLRRELPSGWLAITFIAAPLAAIVLGGASMLVKRNWRGVIAIVYAAFSLLVMLALAAFVGQGPDR